MISIILPTYNNGDKLPKMINSIRKQSFSHWELIIVNDGSNDNTEEICQYYCHLDNRVHYIYQKNMGVSSARNKGILVARGEYITFVDGDDYIDSNYLKELFCSIENADIAVCDVVVENKGKVTHLISDGKQILNQTQALNELLGRKNINTGPCAKLFRTRIIKELQFPHLKCYEDILFVRDAFCRSKNIAITNRTAYHYVVNDLSAMSSIKKEGLLDITIATEDIVSFLSKREDLNPECFYITMSHLMQYATEAVIDRTELGNQLILKSRKIFKKNIIKIITCKAFPIKEKIVYLLYSSGWLYYKKRFIRC